MPWSLITKSLTSGELEAQRAADAPSSSVLRGAVERLLALLSRATGQARTPAHQRAAFTIAFIALAAKMAKADGHVVRSETDVFGRLFQIDPTQAAQAQRVFNLAAQDTGGFEAYAGQMARALAHEPRILRDVFDGLFHIAAADGILHPAEDAFLRIVAGIFGIGAGEFRSIRAAFVHDARGTSGDDPYEVLGIEAGVTDRDLKQRHRELVRDHHPDSLSGRGVPAAFHAAAGRKLAVINAAYDRILRERGLKVDLATVEPSA
jgi:DnaJ like chaperone protein